MKKKQFYIVDTSFPTTSLEWTSMVQMVMIFWRSHFDSEPSNRVIWNNNFIRISSNPGNGRYLTILDFISFKALKNIVCKYKNGSTFDKIESLRAWKRRARKCDWKGTYQYTISLLNTGYSLPSCWVVRFVSCSNPWWLTRNLPPVCRKRRQPIKITLVIYELA